MVTGYIWEHNGKIQLEQTSQGLVDYCQKGLGISSPRSRNCGTFSSSHAEFFGAVSPTNTEKSRKHENLETRKSSKLETPEIRKILKI